MIDLDAIEAEVRYWTPGNYMPVSPATVLALVAAVRAAQKVDRGFITTDALVELQAALAPFEGDSDAH